MKEEIQYIISPCVEMQRLSRLLDKEIMRVSAVKLDDKGKQIYFNHVNSSLSEAKAYADAYVKGFKETK